MFQPLLCSCFSPSGLVQMDESKFWDLLSLIKLPNEEDEGDVGAARAALAELSIEDIQRFEQILIEKLFALDTRVHAGESLENEEDFFSNDGFLYKRCYVVASGKEYFDDILLNPQRMPKDIMLTLEELLYLPQNAYELKTGDDEFLPVTSNLSPETGSNLQGWEETPGLS
ncbi:MAG: hypothetical protein C0469_11720 [Cyanobacteria bacterium DS2.3.42]|nr:hypothetical protein [Cyanobacteria bacterium DS2.3.42]